MANSNSCKPHPHSHLQNIFGMAHRTISEDYLISRIVLNQNGPGEIQFSNAETRKVVITQSSVTLVTQAKYKRNFAIPVNVDPFVFFLGPDFVRWDSVINVTMEFGTGRCFDVHIMSGNLGREIDIADPPRSCAYVAMDYTWRWSATSRSWKVDQSVDCNVYLTSVLRGMINSVDWIQMEFTYYKG